ncbi:DPP IV N-terminal domain-containing protein [bacterium AH-315-C20]|nr:DPP IV N-terminal domain-containing protein [bacterium AH-315-C20]
MRTVLCTLLIGLMALPVTAQKELTLNEAVRQQWGIYRPARTMSLSWIPNTNNFVYLSEDYSTIKMRSTDSEDETDLITAKDLEEWTGYSFDHPSIIEWKDENSFYTSKDGSYYLVNVKNESGRTVAETAGEAENAKLCGTTGAVAYTIGNNLYYAQGEESKIQVTDMKDEFVAGQAIARREFGIIDGIFWSNSGNYLGFYIKDEGPVADYPLLDITTPTGSLKSVKYPMAGQPSEKSGAGVYNMKTKKVVTIKPRGDEEDYITNFSWGPKDEFFYVIEVNRDQNHAQVQKYNAATGDFVATLIEEKNDKWVEPESPLYFVNDKEFIYMSEKDGFMNMYLYSDKGEFVKQLTQNKWVVQDIVGHDVNGNVFFKGTGEDPRQRHYFKINIETGEQVQLTKDGVHNATFSSDFIYFFDAMSSPTIPNLETIRTTKKGKKLREIREADNPYEGITMSSCEQGTIVAGDGKTTLYHRLIKPSDFDKSKKYPVLVYVYGGPHAQMVTDSWLDGSSLWMYWMAEQGYLVYTIDGRGSGNRGFEFESCIHRRLGKYEMDDQLKGVEYLKSLAYVDGDRLAVHGWSYGGFMTTSLMLRQAGIFNVGVAGGPVTDWSYYEVMYGERYMDTPQQNEDGYNDNRLSNYVENLKGDLLLIHGTVDDVVVMQHNLALVKAFVDADVQMDFFPYPMHPHNVRGKDRVHLMRKVLDYVIENNK